MISTNIFFNLNSPPDSPVIQPKKKRLLAIEYQEVVSQNVSILYNVYSLLVF